jgi:hypothetical protein
VLQALRLLFGYRGAYEAGENVLGEIRFGTVLGGQPPPVLEDSPLLRVVDGRKILSRLDLRNLPSQPRSFCSGFDDRSVEILYSMA